MAPIKSIKNVLFKKKAKTPKKTPIKKSVNLTNLSELISEKQRIGRDILKGPNSPLFKKTVLLSKKIKKEGLTEFQINDIINKNFNNYPSQASDVLLYLQYDFMINSHKEHMKKNK
jgi:hypothetical protein